MERSDDLNGGGRRRRLAVIGAVAAILLIGGIGVAVAQTGGSSTTTPSSSTSVPGAGKRGPGFRGGPGGPFGKFGAGPMGAIHGEFVAPDGSGGYRTVDTQTGNATSVSSDSITVKSADGFSKTYSVDQNTVVNSGRDGIGNVKNGDTVRVNAVVSNGKAAAHDIMDMTTLGQIRQHWNPNAPGGPQSGPPTTRT